MPKTKKASVEKRRKLQKLLKNKKIQNSILENSVKKVSTSSKKEKTVVNEKFNKHENDPAEHVEKQNNNVQKRNKYKNKTTKHDKVKTAVINNIIQDNILEKSVKNISTDSKEGKTAVNEEVSNQETETAVNVKKQKDTIKHCNKYEKKSAERDRVKAAVKKTREDENFRKTEKQKDKVRKLNKYHNDQAERERVNAVKANKRQNEHLKTLENEKDAARMVNKYHKDPAERERVKAIKVNKRKNEDFKTLENEKDAARMVNKYHKDPAERERVKAVKANERKNEEYKALENEKDAARMVNKYHKDSAERERVKAVKEKERKNEDFLNLEKIKDAERKRIKYHNDPTEQERIKRSVEKQRENEDFMIEKRERDKQQKKTQRIQEKLTQNENESIQAQEQPTDVNMEVIASSSGQNEIIHGVQEESMDVENQPSFCITLSAEQKKFRQLIKEGPTSVCSCCLRLWFPSSCRKASKLIQEKHGIEFFTKLVNNNITNPILCSSCNTIGRTGKIPKYSSSNYKIIFDVPNELKDLTILEERLVAPRIPFMQIKKLGAGRQCGVKGQIVNVPLNVDTTTNILPRNLNETQTIQLKLKKMISHEHAYLCETIRPRQVLEALKYLLTQPLYQNIVLSNNWIRNVEAEQQPQETIAAPPRNDENEDSCSEFVQEIANWNVNDLFDEFEEEDINEELNPGGDQTLLDQQQLENISFAPGENKTPLHLMLDPDAEELSFPTIFGGNRKEFATKLAYSEITKIQCSHHDRRFVRTDFLLYMFKKYQLMQVVNAVNINLRQKIDKNIHRVGDVLNPEYVNQLVKQDLGFRFLRNIVNSPAHWESEKRKLLAMIRQFNVPTIFFTITAAETVWPELLVILSKIVDGKDVGENEAMNLSFVEKSRLIRTDPVTCSRYFNNRFTLLLKYMRNEQNGPFKNNSVEHYYYRVEFQHRGSPHVHGLLWLRNAPVFDKNRPETIPIIEDFIANFITCDKTVQDVQDVIKYQIHSHSKSCKREINGKKVCRYGIPFLPMDKNTLLLPLTEDENRKKTKEDDQNYLKIKKHLDNNRDDQNTFEEFLQKMMLTKDQYVHLIRKYIKTPTIFLKRNVRDGFVNPFNEDILKIQKSNMDIQFILDPHACLNYIVNYVNKSDRGVSKTLKEAMEEIKKGNLDLKAQLKKLGNVFLNASEVSAQEATYTLLKLHQSETCTSSVYINTKPPEERVKMLRFQTDLEKQNPDSTDIYRSGLLEHYVVRPDSMEDTCLIDFAAFYIFSTVKKSGIALKDGSGFLTKKRHANIIMFRRYSHNQDPTNFYREQLMLYIPWRNEKEELINISHKQLYTAYYDRIVTTSKRYNLLDPDVLEDALAQAEQQDDNEEMAVIDTEPDPEFRIYGVDDREGDAFDGIDGIINVTEDKQTFPTPYQVSDKEFDEIISTLNEKQYEFLNHALKEVKSGNVINNVICGGAGVGKSRLIQAVSQSLIRYYNSLPGNDPSSIKVLLSAPTGKAAFQIGGLTLHSCFSIPVDRSSTDLVPISEDMRNTLYTKLCDLKLVIIDEFSMVGARMFHYIDARLKQIFKSQQDFGGISIIMLGDLKQLPPVGDKFIFAPMRNDPYAVINGSYLWNKFQYFELTEIMRQRDDKIFAMALNNMAVGSMTKEDVKIIKSRETSKYNDLPETIIHLFNSNQEVDSFNEQRLQAYNTERSIATAKDIVKGACSDKMKQQLLNYVKNIKKSESYGLVHNLILQVGAKYMITLNIDTQDGIVNGAAGILRKIEYDTSDVPRKVWMEFYDGKVGNNLRKRIAGLMKVKNIPDTWTLLEKCTRSVHMKKGTTVQVERTQFPMNPAEGITIHKSQGATYQHVAVHLTKGMKRSSIYVACSRATSLRGLFIFGTFNPPAKPSPTDPVFLVLDDLKVSKQLVTRWAKQRLENCEISVAFQNVQSFIKHAKFIASNPIFKNADILLFVETWLRETDNIELTGFNCFAHISSLSTTRKPFGILCFHKTALSNIHTKKRHIENTGSFTFQAISFQVNNTIILVVYVPPKMHISEATRIMEGILSTISDARCLILGDFNCDLLTKPNNSLINLLTNFGFDSVFTTFGSTTNANTHIDWCFSNFSTRCQAETYDTVYSHHKAIVVNTFTDQQNIQCQQLVTSSPTQHQIHPISSVQRDFPENDAFFSDSLIASSSSEKESDGSVIMMEVEENSFRNSSLTNSDQVSCYANCVVQSFLSINDFQLSILKQNSPMNRALYNIFSKRIDNCLAVRKVVGGDFLQREQQDAAQFLTSMLELLDQDFLNLVQFTWHPMVRFCTICGHENKGESNVEKFLTLHFPDTTNDKKISFQNMFDCKESDQICINCHQGYSKNTFELINVSKYLIVVLQRTAWQNNQPVKINTVFNDFDSENIFIQNRSFRLQSLIMHEGDQITSGHYIAITKLETGEFLKCNDDTISTLTKIDQSLKNVYILVLENKC